MEDDPCMLDVTFLSDETWFHLTGCVNFQNTCIWSTENSHAACETPFHLVKIGVCFAVSDLWIVGLDFFENTINSECCIDIANEFLGHLIEEEIAEEWFQQDSETCHTPWATMCELSLFFGDKSFQKESTPHSLDLSPPDFFYGATLKTVPTRITHAIGMTWKPAYSTLFTHDTADSVHKHALSCSVMYAGVHFQNFMWQGVL
jgi:hypothetical protein